MDKYNSTQKIASTYKVSNRNFTISQIKAFSPNLLSLTIFHLTLDNKFFMKFTIAGQAHKQLEDK
ncbi:hypothetical protein C1N86_27790 (plasmid) [Priestia aryabhattai]